MIRRPPRSTLSSSSAASDVYKRQEYGGGLHLFMVMRSTQVLREGWRRGTRGIQLTVSDASIRVPFVSPVMELSLIPDSVELTTTELNAGLNKLSSKCLRQTVLDSATDAMLQTSGCRHTAANVLYFRKQTEHFWKHGNHLPILEQSPFFILLRRGLMAGLTEYLTSMGLSPGKCEDLVSPDRIMIWNSCHQQGSVHPPHVHSDSVLTGTYYSQMPTGAPPLELDDPRGRSPFDVMVSIENRLRYGKGIGGSGNPVPPFNSPYQVSCGAGKMVLFPAWIVHQVPAGTNVHPRVSWSVNLLGSWKELSQLPPLTWPHTIKPLSHTQHPLHGDDDLEFCDPTDARREFTAMLNKFGGAKKGVKRPAGMAQRRPQQK
eukprot:TRINITY_DN49162_c0_g1_i1.p1 TRINITY_DN49162_c0_g1~~TRINITY_DN49162_c0_g1_i1.p1  ORF type:complete len:374 (+),score=50.08 TRINITY_DN49162_c0_g1_i1:133-1254(+)